MAENHRHGKSWHSFRSPMGNRGLCQLFLLSFTLLLLNAAFAFQTALYSVWFSYSCFALLPFAALPDYFSCTSRMPMGHAFAQIPQAIHFVVTGELSAFTITCMGQTSTHSPQPLHSFLSIM